MTLTIYTKEKCGYCVMLKQMLESKDIAYTEINIEENEEAKNFLIEAGHRSVPQIYKDGELFVENGFEGMRTYLSMKEIEERKTWHTTTDSGLI